MVKRKRSYKKYGKRKRGRRRKSYKAKRALSVRVPRKRFLAGGLYAPFKWAKLVYVEHFDSAAQSLAGTIKNICTFRMNGMYDPNYSGTGHQPYLFDEYMSHYNHFRVYAAKITVTVKSTSDTATTGSGVCFIQFHGDTTPDNTLQQTVEESGSAVYRNYGCSDGSNNTVTFSRTMNIAKFMSRKSIAADEFQGNVGSDPSEQCFASVGFANVSPSAVSDAVHCVVRISYLAKFEEPKRVAGS